MADKIHVMQVTFGMGIGGMERVIMDLCRYVDPDRYRFSICCISVRGTLANQMEAEGVPVTFLENQTRWAKRLRGLELARLFRRSDIDILHTHHMPAFIDSFVATRFTRVPVFINTDHCKDYPIPRHWALLERVASHFADEVVAVSHRTRDELIRFEGIAPEKISVIYNGINVKLTRKESREELKRELGLNNCDTVIGTVGRLEDQKGLDLLLASIPHVLRQVPQTKFIIVGGGSKEQELKRLASELKISEHVIFTGWRSDAVDLIQTFDGFVTTSRFEGMPMVLLEAMALSKPIVATSVGGVSEVVNDGFNGTLVNSRDPDEVAKALLTLISDRRSAEQMGHNGRIRYEESFTAEAMASSYDNLYRKYLDRKRA
jgi:glycosyltransferase involved in cell wall biosynthesis